MQLDFVSLHSIVAAEDAHGGSEGAASILGVDVVSLGLQVVTFVLVFLLLRRYAYDPLIGVLESRRKTIEEGLQTAQKMEQREAASQAEREQLLAKAREEANDIMDQSRAQAEELLHKAEADAKFRSEQLMEQSRAQIEHEAKQARAALRDEATELVVAATEKVLGEKLDATKDSELVQRAIKEVGR